MIKSFGDKDTEEFFHGRHVRRVPSEIRDAARRKLDALNHAKTLTDLAVPPGNRLELLKGDRAGQHSIRINGQWRICFVFEDGHAYDVEIVDYHS